MLLDVWKNSTIWHYQLMTITTDWQDFETSSSQTDSGFYPGSMYLRNNLRQTKKCEWMLSWIMNVHGWFPGCFGHSAWRCCSQVVLSRGADKNSWWCLVVFGPKKWWIFGPKIFGPNSARPYTGELESTTAPGSLATASVGNPAGKLSVRLPAGQCFRFWCWALFLGSFFLDFVLVEKKGHITNHFHQFLSFLKPRCIWFSTPRSGWIRDALVCPFVDS